MTPDLDAFGNPIGDSSPAAVTPEPVAASEPMPAPVTSQAPGAGPSVARAGLRALRLAISAGVVVAFAAGGVFAYRAIDDAAEEVTSSISSVRQSVPAVSQAAREVDYQRTPFAEGSMFRAGNLAAAIRRAKAKAPAGARAVSLSVFPGYAVVTFKRRSGDARSVTTWSDGRVNTSDAGSATGRQTFSLADLPLSPMVRYVRSRSQALGNGARGPYAVTIGTTTTSFVNGQVRITTKPATGWLIGFERVPQSKRTVQIDLRGKRLR